MTRAARLLLAAALVLGTLVAAAAVPASADARLRAGDPRPASSRSETTQVQHVRVNWKGSWKKPDYVNTATIPGIGSVDLICKPKDTRIRLFTDERGRETQMWLQKYEVKNGQRVVAVKNARIYRWAHDDDNGKDGTGFYAHEGLNQQASIENRSQDGYMYGVVSQHRSRAEEGPGVGGRPLPITTFELTWNWNGFDHPQQYRSCTIDAVFTTQFPATSRPSITWRGWQPNPVTTTSAAIDGIGTLQLSCPDDRATGGTTGAYLSVTPTPTTLDDGTIAPSSLYVEDVRGEGTLAEHRTTTEVQATGENQFLGPYPLPSNGSLRMRVTNGARSTWILLSSYYKTNDPRTHRNLCEVAAGFYDR